MTEIALILETIVFCLGLFFCFKKEKIFGIYFLFLFVYVFFAQVGYAYTPNLSESIKAYFGEDVWFSVAQFVILSLLAIQILFLLFWEKVVNLIPVTFSTRASRNYALENCSVWILIVVVVFQTFYLALNFDDISWYSNQDEDFRPGNFLFVLFLMLFKFFVAINFVLYVIVRDRLGSRHLGFYVTMLFVCLTLFSVTAFRLGNRTDILALALGLLVYSLYREKIDFSKAIKIFCSGVAIAIILHVVEAARYNDDQSERNLLESILLKDWYAPAHILFAAVHFELIQPFEVFVSNAANSLVLMGYPYLQFDATELFNPGVATRSAGYAFYAFAEGYMAMGDIGFIYNAVIVVFGMALWKSLASTKNKNFNNFLLGLMGCMLVNLVRGQSSYFIKYLYTFVIPGALLYTALTGQALILTLKKRSEK